MIGLVLQRENIEMAENLPTIETWLVKRIEGMIRIGQRRDTEMIEMLHETGRGTGIVNVLENEVAIVRGIEIVIVIVIGMIEIDMLIIIGTRTVSKNMMMMTEEDHLGDTANHDYHMRKTIGQDQGMLIMGRGDV